MDNKKNNFFKILITKVFHNYLWIGLVIILISIILSISMENKSPYLSIVIKLLESIGISIFIASIFSFAASSSDFVERVRKLLEEIIVKRNFLANIEPDKKKEVLRTLITPSDIELENFPNINDYYNYFINNIISVSSKNVRSNYNIRTKIYFDESDNKIKSEGIYSYRLYPSKEGFSPVRIGFNEEQNTGSICEYVKIYNSKGEMKTFTKENIILQSISIEGATNCRKEGKIDISDDEISKNEKYLDIELKVIEIGTQGSLLLEFTALQPTNGFKFILECHDNLKIEDHAVFVVNAKHYENIDEAHQNLSITCNQWINEGSGLCVSIVNHSIENK